MKYLFFIILLLFGLKNQAQEKHSYYITPQFDIGNFIGGSFHLNYVYQEKYSFKTGISGVVRTAKSQPKDFTAGPFTQIFSFGFTSPYDNISSYQLQVGRIFKLKENGKIRLNTSVGVAYTTIKKPSNWEYNYEKTIGANYTYQYTKSHIPSLVINPEIEFPISRLLGLSISPTLILNKEDTYVGVGFGSLFGKLKSRNKEK